MLLLNKISMLSMSMVVDLCLAVDALCGLNRVFFFFCPWFYVTKLFCCLDIYRLCCLFLTDYCNDKQESRFNVIAVNSYKARQEPELNFNKGTKFEVVGCISEKWLIGELQGKRGAFPAECIKVIHKLEIEERNLL